jgi:nucleoside-diphosphate-sugar epimerase
MIVFLTGGTGAIGRPLVPRLITAGHSVRATVRSEEKAALVRQMGAEPVAVDLFDGDALAAAVDGSDAVLHFATSIPPVSKAMRASAWTANDRLRSETTALLVGAAERAGVGRVVAESITFTYRDSGAEWIDETTPLDVAGGLAASVVRLEELVTGFAAGGGAGVVLRFGLFYGPDTRLDEALRLARRRVSPVPGRRDAYVSSIHTDDAAAAVVAALDAPAGVFNVVDDEPVTRTDYVEAFARAFGLARLRGLPAWALKLGEVVADADVGILGRSQRVSNRRFREATGWVPAHPSVRTGWQATADAYRAAAGVAP